MNTFIIILEFLEDLFSFQVFSVNYKNLLMHIDWFKKSRFIFLLLILISKLCAAQELFVQECGSFTFLNSRKNVSYFNRLLNEDSSSELQILYVQLDNPKFGKLESYFFKIDSNGNAYKCAFKDAVPKYDSSGVDKRYKDDELPSINTLQNTNFVIIGNEYRKYYSVCLVVKRKNKFVGFLFTDVSVQSAVDKLTELVEGKKAFEILNAEFVIEKYDVWDG